MAGLGQASHKHSFSVFDNVKKITIIFLQGKKNHKKMPKLRHRKSSIFSNVVICNEMYTIERSVF